MKRKHTNEVSFGRIRKELTRHQVTLFNNTLITYTVKILDECSQHRIYYTYVKNKPEHRTHVIMYEDQQMQGVKRKNN